jgi:hypothetical protein
MRLAGVLVVALVAALAVGQATPPERGYENQAEVDALDELLRTGVDKSISAQDLAELSHLLSSPCDQLRWLLGRARAVQHDPGTPQAAKALAEAANARGATLEAGSFLGDCGDVLAELRKLVEAAVSPLELIGSAAVNDWLKRPNDLTTLQPGEKFALLARGATEAQLFKAEPNEPWDLPRRIVGRLAQGPQLPEFSTLRNFRKQLTSTYEHWKEANFQPFAEPAQQKVVQDSFQIAAALLDRALGLDVQDVMRTARAIDYPLDPAGFTQLAEELEGGRCHTWSVLARMLAATTAGTVDGEALGKTWAEVQAVNPGLWAAVGDPNNGWLARLVTGGRRNAPGMLPLAADFRAKARDKRKDYEDKVQRLIQEGVPDTADTTDLVFQAIQLAKAADLGVATEPKPLSVARVKELFGGDTTNEVYLFVEMLALPEVTPLQGGPYCGVAFYRRLYLEPSEANKKTYADRYEVKVLRSAGDIQRLVEAALADPGPLKGAAEARILIAPDGPPPATWFGFEQERLLPLARTSKSWIVYLPSALAMERNWTLEDTLRIWYRLALQDATLLDLELGAGDLGPCPLKSNPIKDMVVLCLWQGKSKEEKHELPDFMSYKRDKKIPALPLWVRK